MGNAVRRTHAHFGGGKVTTANISCVGVILLPFLRCTEHKRGGAQTGQIVAIKKIRLGKAKEVCLM